MIKNKHLSFSVVPVDRNRFHVSTSADKNIRVCEQLGKIFIIVHFKIVAFSKTYLCRLTKSITRPIANIQCLLRLNHTMVCVDSYLTFNFNSFLTFRQILRVSMDK